MTPLHSTILQIISEKSIKRKDLLMRVNACGYCISDRMLRKSVEELISEHSIAISSGDFGYKLIFTNKEFMEVENYLRKKSLSIFKRVKDIRKAMNKEQITFDEFIEMTNG